MVPPELVTGSGQRHCPGIWGGLWEASRSLFWGEPFIHLSVLYSPGESQASKPPPGREGAEDQAQALQTPFFAVGGWLPGLSGSHKGPFPSFPLGLVMLVGS